jgi:hypothetical protein
VWDRPVGVEEAREKRPKVVRGTWAAMHRRVRRRRTSALRILDRPFRVGFHYLLGSGVGRGCVKTQNGTCSQNIGLPKRVVFDYFWLGIDRKTPEFEIALSLYTASAACRHVANRPTAEVGLRPLLECCVRRVIPHRLCKRTQALTRSNATAQRLGVTNA